jgi:predicted nucleotidyltransferase
VLIIVSDYEIKSARAERKGFQISFGKSGREERRFKMGAKESERSLGDLKEEIGKAAAALRAAGAREVYLFGSAARGNLRENSDIDMAVSGLPPKRFFHAMGEVSRIFNRSLDLIDLDEDNPFTRYLKEGVVATNKEQLPARPREGERAESLSVSHRLKKLPVEEEIAGKEKSI